MLESFIGLIIAWWHERRNRWRRVTIVRGTPYDKELAFPTEFAKAIGRIYRDDVNPGPEPGRKGWWRASEQEDETWGLVTPFLTDDPMFCFGVEFGIFFRDLRNCETDEFSGQFHVENQERLLVCAQRLGWHVERTEVLESPYQEWCVIELSR